MRSTIRGLSMGVWPGTLFAFVACLFVVPGSSLAGCPSHFVPSLSFSTGSGIGLETIDQAGARAVADLAERPHGPKPCTGEMCSSRPAVPVLPAPPQILRVQVWAILEVATAIALTEHADSRPDEAEARPILSPDPIFHPPRLSPSFLTS
jgi:hypothetical protein